jgi:acyl-CoA oxidase
MATIGAPCLDQYKQMLQNLAALPQVIKYTRHDDDADNRYHTARGSALFLYDTAFGTFVGVHQTLYYDTLMVLGSEKHRSLQDLALSLENVGCFCMTEFGHGSNVIGIETTATYDHSRREFVLNTPHANAAKCWIGALGRTANKASVFAQLYVNDENVGVHVFVIDIREYDTHEPKPGCIIGNLGEKLGLNGIDNGFIFFQNYRVPYDSLLDRFSQVSPEGKFKSSIKNKEKRFGTMMTGLTRGRLGVLMQCQSNL